jgi:hypothetical protein
MMEITIRSDFLKEKGHPAMAFSLKVQKTVYCTHNKQKRTGLLLLAFKTNIHLLRQRLICAKFFPFSTPIPLSDEIKIGLENCNKKKTTVQFIKKICQPIKCILCNLERKFRRD